MKRLSVALIFVLILCGCSDFSAPESMSISNYSSFKSKESDLYSASPATNITSTLSPRNSQKIKPTVLDIFNTKPFFIIHEYSLETDEIIYYLQGHSVYSLTKADGKSHLVDKTNLDIKNLLFSKNQELYILGRLLGRNPDLKYNLYMHSNNEDKIVCKDIDELLYSDENFLYYVYNQSIYKYDVTANKSFIVDFDINRNLDVGYIMPSENIVHLYSYVTFLNYEYNFNTNTYKILPNISIDFLTDDSKYQIAYDSSYHSDDNENYIVQDRNGNNIGSFSLSNTLMLNNVFIKGNTAYLLVEGYQNISIYTIDLTSGKTTSQRDVYLSNFINGYQCCCKFYNNKWYIYLHDSDKEIDSNESDLNYTYNVKPMLFVFDLSENKLKKIWVHKTEKFDYRHLPDFVFINNQLWLYVKNEFSGYKDGTYKFWFKAPIE